MKPEEAIETLENHAQYYIPIFDLVAFEAAIEALREVQKYREIGTVEECREAVEKQKKSDRVFTTLYSGNYNDENLEGIENG